MEALEVHSVESNQDSMNEETFCNRRPCYRLNRYELLSIGELPEEEESADDDVYTSPRLVSLSPRDRQWSEKSSDSQQNFEDPCIMQPKIMPSSIPSTTSFEDQLELIEFSSKRINGPHIKCQMTPTQYVCATKVKTQDYPDYHFYSDTSKPPLLPEEEQKRPRDAKAKRKHETASVQGVSDTSS